MVDTQTPHARFVTIGNTATGRELRVYGGTPPSESPGWGALASPATASTQDLEAAVERLFRHAGGRVPLASGR